MSFRRSPELDLKSFGTSAAHTGKSCSAGASEHFKVRTIGEESLQRGQANKPNGLYVQGVPQDPQKAVEMVTRVRRTWGRWIANLTL